MGLGGGGKKKKDWGCTFTDVTAKEKDGGSLGKGGGRGELMVSINATGFTLKREGAEPNCSNAVLTCREKRGRFPAREGDQKFSFVLRMGDIWFKGPSRPEEGDRFKKILSRKNGNLSFAFVGGEYQVKGRGGKELIFI